MCARAWPARAGRSGAVVLPAPQDPAQLAQIATISVHAWDEVGSASDAVEEFVQRTLDVNEGDPCDRLSARSRCPEGLTCIDDAAPGEENLLCLRVETTCPAEWTVVDLNLGGEADN